MRKNYTFVSSDTTIQTSHKSNLCNNKGYATSQQKTVKPNFRTAIFCFQEMQYLKVDM